MFMQKVSDVCNNDLKTPLPVSMCVENETINDYSNVSCFSLGFHKCKNKIDSVRQRFKSMRVKKIAYFHQIDDKYL